MPLPEKARLTFLPLGDRALLLDVGAEAGAQTVSRVRALADYLAQLQLPGIVDLVPAICTIGIHYDPVYWGGAAEKHTAYERLVQRLGELLDDFDMLPAGAGQTQDIPVCYEPEYALDLASLARARGVSEQQVIDIHAGAQYSVYMIGFAPGFAYLGPLDERLVLPRRETPRTLVPAGSVAVANEYTGIYPGPLPGGWHIIGRTPLRLFDPARPQPSLLQSGDLVRFVPIDAQQYRSLEAGRE